MKTKLSKIRSALLAVALTLFASPAFSGSATWSLIPTSGDWNTAANWTPATVPNGSADQATFQLSVISAVSISANTEVNGIVFTGGPTLYTITASPAFTLTISGAGITNSSGLTQNFVTLDDGFGNHGVITFTNSATAGVLTAFTNNGGTVSGAFGGSTQFTNTSTAGNGTFTNKSGTVIDAFGGLTQFAGSSTAGNGTFVNNGGTVSGLGNRLGGGLTFFYDTSTAGNGVFITNGGTATDAVGGLTQFYDSSTAGNGTFTINGGTVDRSGGGSEEFHDTSTAGNGTFTTNGGTVSGAGFGSILFHDSSTAGNGDFTNNGGTVSGAGGGFMSFFDSSTASNSTITNNGGTVSGAFGGSTQFADVSTTADGTIINNGGTVSGAGGGATVFFASSTAGNATLMANGGSGGGQGGALLFFGDSTGGTSRVEVFGNGNLDISLHNAPGVTIGSIEGDGNVFLGANSLIVGSNNLSTTFSGVIQDGGIFAGTGGSLTKTGTGTLILSGSNTYTGDTTINDGVLQVDGSIASLNTFVNADGTLAGIGTVGGSVFNSGVVSPGDDSPGTLTVNGNYTQNSNGTLRIEIGGRNSGEFDLLQMGGTAALDGRLQLVRLNNFSLLPGDKIIFLTATGGVNATFSTIDNPFATGTIVTAQVVYEPNDVALEFGQGSFAGLSGLTPNQTAVAKALDRIVTAPGAAALIMFLETELLGRLPADLNRIAPEELTAIFEIGISTANVQSYNIENRLEEIRNGSNGFSSTLSVVDSKGSHNLRLSSGKEILTDGSGKSVLDKALAPPSPENRWGFFVSGSGEFVTVDGDFNSSGYDLQTGGITLGLDYRITEHLAIGLTGGYAHSNADLIDNGDVDVNSGKLGLYGTWFSGGAYLNGLVEGGYNSYDTHRRALLGFARGDTDGGEFSALFGSGYDFKRGNWAIGPTASLQYTLVSINSFTESGSLAPLTIHSQDEDALRTRLGGRLCYRMQTGNVIVRPELRAEWKHEFLDEALAIDSSFAGISRSSFTVHGPSRGRDSALLSAGLNVQWCSRIQTFVSYQADVGRGNYAQQSVTGGLRINF